MTPVMIPLVLGTQCIALTGNLGVNLTLPSMQYVGLTFFHGSTLIVR